MKKSHGIIHGAVCAVILSFALLPTLAGCATMGEQYISNPFPEYSRIYFSRSMIDLYKENKIYWSGVEAIWCDAAIAELTAKGYTFTDDRNEADVELKLRYGNTRFTQILGTEVVYSGFRIQLVDVKSEEAVLNKWEEKIVNTGGKYVGDREIKDFLDDFTHRAFMFVPLR